ncbi:hypothetical protein Tco_0965401 [Tanacetum coccineum]
MEDEEWPRWMEFLRVHLGALGLEVEALVDAMEQSGLTFKEETVSLFRRCGDVMMIQSDEWKKMRQSGGPLGYHGHFEVYEFVLELEDA